MTHTSLDEYIDSANPPCFLEPSLSIRVRIATRRELPLRVIKYDSRLAAGEIQFFRWRLNNEHLPKLAESNTSRQLFGGQKIPVGVVLVGIPIDGVPLGDENL
jgi:hypothetical protein